MLSKIDFTSKGLLQFQYAKYGLHMTALKRERVRVS
jgi:hypothetical protein